jgi:hypothetical protein
VLTVQGDVSASGGTITGLNYINNGIVANSKVTGSFTGSFTGPLVGTASHAESSSHAVTASFALNGGGNGSTFPFSGSAQVTGSFNVTGSFTATTASFDVIENTGTGVPTIISDTNIILTASNAVVINKVLRLTNTTSQSITSPANGDIIYDSNVNKFLGYANGNWVAFHS